MLKDFHIEMSRWE